MKSVAIDALVIMYTLKNNKDGIEAMMQVHIDGIESTN